MIEIEVLIGLDCPSWQYNVVWRLYRGKSLAKFDSFAEALAFCSDHQLTITNYYVDGMEITKEQMPQ